MTNYLQFFISLFSILNPILAISLYLNMTSGFSKIEKRTIETVCGITVFSILSACVFFGNAFISLLSIHPYSLQLGGGIIILLIGVSTILKQEPRKIEITNEIQNSEKLKNFGVSPLGIPMVVGPGAIVMTLLYAQEANGIIMKLPLIGIIFLISILVVIILRLANYISKIIGETGILVMSKLMGLLLTAVAFELIVEGLKTVVQEFMKNS